MPKAHPVHNHTVYFSEDAQNGFEYLLHDLDMEEARVFFDQAKLRGSAEFEDDRDHQYTLDYQNGKYFLTKR